MYELDVPIWIAYESQIQEILKPYDNCLKMGVPYSYFLLWNSFKQMVMIIVHTFTPCSPEYRKVTVVQPSVEVEKFSKRIFNYLRIVFFYFSNSRNKFSIWTSCNLNGMCISYLLPKRAIRLDRISFRLKNITESMKIKCIRHLVFTLWYLSPFQTLHLVETIEVSNL